MLYSQKKKSGKTKTDILFLFSKSISAQSHLTVTDRLLFVHAVHGISSTSIKTRAEPEKKFHESMLYLEENSFDLSV